MTNKSGRDGGGGGGSSGSKICWGGYEFSSSGGRKKIDAEKPQLSSWRLRDEVLTLFQEV